jgi:superfamily II DNA or RNA helicase
LITLVHYSGCLIIRGRPLEPFKRLLRHERKELGWNEKKRVRETIRSTEELFCSETGPDGQEQLRTMQGFKDKVVLECIIRGIQFQYEDRRFPMFHPELENAQGFYLNQEQLFRKLVLANESGLLQAPTRYGKTIMIVNALRVYPGVTTVVTAPGVDLLKQLFADLKEKLPDREIRGIYTGSRGKVMSEDITVCSFDSLAKLTFDDVRLVLVDEPHAAVSTKRAPLLAQFQYARILGFGATLTGRYDGGDELITGLIGPVHAKRTFLEAVEEGAICMIRVYIIKIWFTPQPYRDRNAAYDNLLYNSADMMECMRQVCMNHIPADWQTLVFIDRATQGDIAQQFMPGAAVAVAGNMTSKEREQLFKDMVDNEIKRCVCTGIYAQGVTFPDVRVMVNMAGGGGSITGIQKPGRLAQVRPGKSRGYVVDFQFEPHPDRPYVRGAWDQVVRDGKARRKAYEETGYEIVELNSLDGLSFD